MENQATNTASTTTSNRVAEDWSAFYYDPRAAERPIKFIERHVVHVKGRLAGKPFKLAPWQKKMIRRLFGWKDLETDCRKFRTLFLFIAKKNGKSILAAALALFLLCADGEAGAEIMCAAADKDQGRIIFDMAAKMVEASDSLRRSCQVFKDSIIHLRSGSVFKVISSIAATKHGPDLHGLIVDEVHVQKTDTLINTLHAGTVARSQPLSIFCSTAGVNKDSVCGKMYEHAKAVKEKRVIDPTLLPVIFESPPVPEGVSAHDWYQRPDVWKAANPGLGVSVTLTYMREKALKAANDPEYENTFLQLHLNLWVGQQKRWIPMHIYDAPGNALPIHLEELAGRECYGGLDLASVEDVTALVLAFPREVPETEPPERFFTLLPFLFVPEFQIEERQQSLARTKYLVWASQGHLIATPGRSTDYDYIREKAKELAARYKIKEVAFDRWNSSQLVAQLTADGLKMIEMGQGVASMSSPSKEFYKHLLDGRVQHGGHPVLRWMASNIAKKQDAAGNIKPDKEKSGDKIDGIVAAIMALSRCFVNEKKRSVYSKRGLLTVG